MPRYFGVDYGQRRVGFALSDPSGTIALPVATCDVRSLKQAVETTVMQFRKIVPPPCKIVVGLPLNMNGTASTMSAEVLNYVEQLKAAVKIDVITWDERLSTALVDKMLIAADVSRNGRKAVRDKLAAQVILQGYLDSLDNGMGS